MNGSPRLWTLAAVGSGLAHVGLIIVASLLPEPERPTGGAADRDQLYTPGAVIPIEARPQMIAADLPSVEPTWPAESRATSEEPAGESNDGSSAALPAPGSGTAGSDTAPSPSPLPENTMLHGMRRDARSRATIGSGGGSGVIDPGSLMGSREDYRSSVDRPGRGGGAVQGPAAPAKAGPKYAFKRERGKLVYRDPSGHFVAFLRADGRVDFRNKGAKASWTQIGIGDPGGLVAKAAGSDPNARLKAKLLEATFELRLGMAIKFQKKQIDKGLRRLKKDLEKIWTDERRDLAARKRLLFERWDECDEPEDIAGGSSSLPGFAEADASELDTARRDAAGKARQEIEKFVRKHAPKGSPEAYSSSELAELNRGRSSKQKFAPY